jgi:hypothetical protein
MQRILSGRFLRIVTPIFRKGFFYSLNDQVERPRQDRYRSREFTVPSKARC